MSLERLPYEIVDIIFKHIERKTYYPHLFVSKRWHALVKPIYYRELKISTHWFEWILRQLSLGEKNFESLKYLSFTTKLLVFYGNLTPSFKAEEVLFLLSYFKNLKTLDVSQSAYNDICLDALSMCDVRIFPQLEEINTKDLQAAYLPVISRFRHSLKIFTFNCQNLTDLGGGDLLNTLSSFQNLTELRLLNRTVKSITLFNVLDACPNLSKIYYFTNYAAESEHYMPQNQETYSARRPHKNLKYMSLNVPSLSAPYIYFLMENCPSSLNQLIIRIEENSFFDWIKSTTLELVLKLASCLSKVDLQTLYIETGDEDMEGEEIRPGFPSKLDIFHQILSELKGDRNWDRCTARYETTWSFKSHICIRNNRSLSYQYFLNTVDYGLDIEDFYSEASDYYNSYREAITYDMYPVPTPSKYWIAGPQIINELKFRFENEKFKKLPTECFAYAAANCPQLSSFSVYYNSDTSSLVYAKQEHGGRSILKDMAIVVVKEIVHNQKNLSILLYNFPNVKYLTYYASIKREAVFDLTKFKNLRTFKVDITSVIELYGSQNVFLDIQILGKNTAYFEIQEKKRKSDSKLTYLLRARPVGKSYDPAIRKYAFCIKCLPQLENLTISSLSPIFKLAKYSSLHLKPNFAAVGHNMEEPIILF